MYYIIYHSSIGSIVVRDNRARETIRQGTKGIVLDY